VGKHLISKIGEYKWEQGQIRKTGGSDWNAKVWITTPIKGLWEAKFQIHQLNSSDGSGLVFGVWGAENKRVD